MSRGLRWALTVCGLLLGAYVAYVLIVFIGLQNGALAAMTQNSENAKLQASGGHSFWPGVVHLRDVRFRFKDYNIEMAIEAREATVRWSPLALFAKTIQVDEITADGARYEMLHRVKRARPSDPRLAAFPDVGFERSKVYDSPKPPYRVPPFRVRVEKIRANVEEAWILEYRAVGQIEAEGGFEVHEKVTVLPSRAIFRGARIFMGPRELASRLDCDVRARIEPFPGRENLEVALRSTTGSVLCDVNVSDLSALRMYFDDELRLEGQAEVLADVQLAAGQVRSSKFRAAVEIEQVGVEGAFLSGRARLGADVDAGGLASIEGAFFGDTSDESTLGLDRAKFNVVAQQRQALKATLEQVDLDLEGLNVTDPELLRRLRESDATPLLKVERATLSASYIAPKDDAAGKLDFESQGALALFPKAGATLACDHQAVVRCKLGQDGVSCPGSVVACTPLQANLGEGQVGRIGATLRADALELENGRASSDWTISLGNPKDMLRALLPDNTWAELGLSLAPLGTVQGRIRVNRREQTLAGTVDHVSTGPFEAAAGFVLAESFVSRWRVLTPLGRFGVSQTTGETTITPLVGRDWDILAFEN